MGVGDLRQPGRGDLFPHRHDKSLQESPAARAEPVRPEDLPFGIADEFDKP